MKKYDILIIGSGPGGYVAGIRASQLNMKVGIIEKAELGGVCLNWGCIPTKALLKSAQVYKYLKYSSDYGVIATTPKANLPAMIKRSRKIATDMSAGIQYLFKKNKIDHIVGHGKLKNKTTVEVTDSTGKKTDYQAQHILLATGGRPRELPALPIDGKTIISYRDALTLSSLPKRITIIGSGAIGVEFAYFYATLGVQVTLIEFLPHILPLEDEDISKALERNFKKEGITIHTNTEVTQVNKTTKGIVVTANTKDPSASPLKIETDIVLSSVGITANLENLGLEEIGLKTENGKLPVDEFYRTSVDGIYAIGDIVKGQALAHVASAEGIICVEKIANQTPQPLDYNNIPACTYCTPEVASVGHTEESAKKAGYSIKVGKFPFSASGKAKASGSSDGFVKVIFESQYGEWLGAHFIGANVTEMIGEVVVARKLETTGHEIMKAVHPHPTMSEAIMEATAVAYNEAIHI